jgi:hypothetical protein
MSPTLGADFFLGGVQYCAKMWKIKMDFSVTILAFFSIQNNLNFHNFFSNFFLPHLDSDFSLVTL